MQAPQRHSYPSGRKEQFIIRFPDGLRDEIKKAAAENRRSMNSEIVVQLEKAFGLKQTQKADARA